MTQENIQTLAKVNIQIKSRENHITMLKEQLKRLEDIKGKVLKTCDHEYPDGRSAIVEGYMFVECKICGQ